MTRPQQTQPIRPTLAATPSWRFWSNFAVLYASVAVLATPTAAIQKVPTEETVAVYSSTCHQDIVMYIRAARAQEPTNDGRSETRWKYFIRMSHKGYSTSQPALAFQLVPQGRMKENVTGFSGYLNLNPKQGYEAQLGIDKRPSAKPLLPTSQWLEATKIRCD